MENDIELLKNIIKNQEIMIQKYEQIIDSYKHLCQIKDDKIKYLQERLGQ